MVEDGEERERYRSRSVRCHIRIHSRRCSSVEPLHDARLDSPHLFDSKFNHQCERRTAECRRRLNVDNVRLAVQVHVELAEVVVGTLRVGVHLRNCCRRARARLEGMGVAGAGCSVQQRISLFLLRRGRTQRRKCESRLDASYMYAHVPTAECNGCRSTPSPPYSRPTRKTPEVR